MFCTVAALVLVFFLFVFLFFNLTWFLGCLLCRGLWFLAVPFVCVFRVIFFLLREVWRGVF